MKTTFRLLILAFLHIAVCHAALTDGLVGHWTFSGNANDSSGNGHNGTVTGATLTADRFGVSNSAYYFNGIDNLIRCSDTNFPAGNSPRTVSLWAKIASFGSPTRNVAYLFSYGTDGLTDAFYLITDGVNAGGPYIKVGRSGGGDYPSFPGPSTNVWYHLTVTHNGSTTTLYVNGATAFPGSRTYATTLSGFFNIGSYMGSFPPTHHGVLDDVRVYNRALSGAEVQQLYVSESTTNPNLVINGSFEAPGFTNGNAGAGRQRFISPSAGITNWALSGTGDVFLSGSSLFRVGKIMRV